MSAAGVFRAATKAAYCVLMAGLAVLPACASLPLSTMESVPPSLNSGFLHDSSQPPLSRASSAGLPIATARVNAKARAIPGFIEAKPRREVPYTYAQLLDNFLTIALEAEASDMLANDTGTVISKWDQPIRYRLLNATPQNKEQIETFSARLTELTGLIIREAYPAERHNMDIRFVPPSHRAIEAAQVLNLGYVGPSVARLVSEWRDYEQHRCFAVTTQRPDTFNTEVAYIFIKAELPADLRETCIIEEMAQSLGLLNDDNSVKPSIFNDDGRHLTLTSHDELLLRILYHPSIRSGMTARQVRPLARQIINRISAAGEGV